MIWHSFSSEVSKIIYFFIMLLLFFTADFSLTPKSMNVTLGGLVEFDCYPYYPHHNILWYINKTVLSLLNSSGIAVLYNTTVQISAKQQFNNTHISCALHNTAITSPRALLLIQGIQKISNNKNDNYIVYLLGEPGPVEDIHVTDSPPDFLLVSWTAPFSLDITDSDLDLWYSLSILTPTSGSLLPFTCPDCQYITDTSYNLSVSGLTQGVYEIQVLSVNAYSSSSQPSKIPLYVRMAPNTHDYLCGINPNITTGN